MGNRLNPAQRQQDLAALQNEDFDVVVIGGGVTGAGVALDAASRGLKTAIVEAQDWGSGASSRSTRLVRGGLRYLYNFDVKLVTESIRERALLLNVIAPHLVRLQPFVWPLRAGLVDRAQALAGIGMFETLNRTVGRRVLPAHRHLSTAAVLERFPEIKPDALSGAIEFYDARVDDARLVLTLVRTAQEYGARAASRTQVVRITRAEDAPVTGLVVRDLETGDEFQVRTRGIINATGVWTERTQSLAQTNEGLKVLATKGVHLLVPGDRITASSGLFWRTADAGAIYIMPWRDNWMIGTTDTTWHQPLTHPVPTRADVDRLLGEVNQMLQRSLRREDVMGSYAGLRPLLQPPHYDESRTTSLSREHSVAHVAPGMIAVAGGNLTTYRAMAAEAVDFLLGKQEAAKRPSITHRTPLLGAQGIEAMTNQAERIGGIYGWKPELMSRLLQAYGSELPELLEMVDDDPTMAAPLRSAPQYLRAEVAYACIAEGVLHLEDLLVQRIRLNTEAPDRGASAVDEVAAIAAPLLDWDADRLAEEKSNYRARIRAELAAEQETTDEAAAAIRRQAPDIVVSELD